jgi:hypothetical protein
VAFDGTFRDSKGLGHLVDLEATEVAELYDFRAAFVLTGQLFESGVQGQQPIGIELVPVER